MKDIYRYILNNYHILQMNNKGMHSINCKVLADGIYNLISNLKTAHELVPKDIQLVFINTVERKSKYLTTDEKDYIFLDLHQIVECTWGSQVAVRIEGDMDTVISGTDSYDKDGYKNISMSYFLYSSNKNILKARICNCYNLADLCFSKGYVDAAIKNLCFVKAIREEIHESKNNCNDLIDKYISGNLLYEAENMGLFIFLHELTHYNIAFRKKSISGMQEYRKLVDLIRLRYENGDLSKEWRKYAKQYSYDNDIENCHISDLFVKLKINDRYPELYQQLKINILSWKELYFDLDNWNLYSEELVCDIVALNALIDNEKFNFFWISYIIRFLLIQETFSLQNNLLNYIMGKEKTICSLNIKRVQLIFSALVVDYQERKKQKKWESIINYSDDENIGFEIFLEDICTSIELIHENFYLTSIKDFCKLLLSDDILHKHINCAYYLNNISKDFVFTDDYNGKIYSKKHINSFDAILLQNDLTEEYNNYVDFIFG